MAEKPVDDIGIIDDVGKAVEKTTIADSEAIKQSRITQTLEENVQKSDLKESKQAESDVKSSCEIKALKPTEGDPERSNIKESKVAEDVESCCSGKEPKPTKSDYERSDIKESKVSEDVKSCFSVKEPRASGADVKEPRASGADVKEPRATGADVKEPRASGADVKEPRATGADVKEPRATGADGKEPRATGADVKEPRATGADVKESMVAEDVKSYCDNKESKPTKCSAESSDITETKASEDNVEELKPKDGDVKVLEPTEGDTKESKASEDVKICCDTKTSKFVKGDEKSESTDGDSKGSVIEKVKQSSVAPAENKGQINRTNSSTSIGSSTTVDCAATAIKESEDDKKKSKRTSNLDYLEKGMPSNKYVDMPEFYKLGLVGSPEASESKPNDYVFVSESEGASKPEGACFNWFKRVSNSPQKLFSRFKKYTSPKSASKRPIISSECHGDDSFKSPGLSPIGNDKHFMCSYMGKNNLEWMLPVDRIDYAKLAEDKIIPAFLGMHPCYDVMPTSGKVIVLSVDLLVKNAFSALVTNEIKAAPLWDTGLHDFIGMLTISDFINVLRHYFYSNPEDIKDIENQAISTWRKMTKMTNKFIKINGGDSLALATKLLIQEGVHRIPVFDEKRKCVLFVLTRKRLLQYLSYSLFEKFEKSNIKTPSFFRKTLRELQVGTYENIATTTVNGRVIDALDLFVERKVSSLPVVDENGELKDIFEKFDVFVLAKEQTYHNLEMTVLEAITKAGSREGAVICTLDESLGTVINKFVNSKVHRIVVINERQIVIGIVSLSDILKFLVVQPLAAMEDSSLSAVASDIIEEGAEGAVGGSDVETSVFESGELDSSTSLLTEESDKNASSLSEGISDMKISSAPEDSEEKLDGNDVQKSE